MSKSASKDIGKLMADHVLIQQALGQAVREARRQHKLAGNCVVEWRDGRVVWVPPEEIDVEPPAPMKRAAANIPPRPNGRRRKKS
jgi:hypothetical protein